MGWPEKTSQEKGYKLRYLDKESGMSKARKELPEREEQHVLRSRRGKESAVFQELTEVQCDQPERKAHEMNVESQEGLVHTSHCRPCCGLLLRTAGTIPQRYVIRSKSLKEKVLQLLCGNSMFGVWGSKNKGGKNSGKGSEKSQQFQGELTGLR